MLALRCPPAFHAPVAPPTRPAPRHVERGREASGQAACLATALLLGASVRTATARAARPKMQKKKKSKPLHFGPKKLRSGYWQEDTEIDDDIDIFDWFNAEDLLDDPPASVSAVQEVATFTELEEGLVPFDAPEYRPPPPKCQLAKGLKNPPFVDQQPGRSFTANIQQQVSDFGQEGSMEDADIVTSVQALRTMLAFVDGTLTEDMRAKGLNTRRGSQAQRVDLFRVGRLPDAPNAISIGTVWSWVPENAAAGSANFNKRSYDVNFQYVVTGNETVDGPPCIREVDDPLHVRILKYTVGGLNMVVQAPVTCTMPTADEDAMPNTNMGVECSTANTRDAGDLWGEFLPTKLAEMKLGNVGMLVRGVVDKGFLIELQEVTQDDLRLDRSTLEAESDALIGKLVGLLKRIKEVSECPGCINRVLYLQYCDGELRVISPWTEDELAELASFRQVSNKEVEELLYGD
ncbi:unnamed protein product [Effrenium voratum]|uniref:Uncharacterized protein n=1 Tax=Effrenium voratum TaxID=2562239 RepID=A0AA36IQ07_9DINO|nr:unnamed protein product [Effrenium voratum]CAJ1442253.1 unnamed protein product [Effrenium voratum]